MLTHNIQNESKGEPDCSPFGDTIPVNDPTAERTTDDEKRHTHM